MKILFSLLFIFFIFPQSSYALSPSVKFDMLQMQLDEQIKSGDYSAATKTIQALKNTGIQLPSSVQFLEGKVLFETGKKAESYELFAHYAETQGRQGKYYQESIAYLIKAEPDYKKQNPNKKQHSSNDTAKDKKTAEKITTDYSTTELLSPLLRVSHAADIERNQWQKEWKRMLDLGYMDNKSIARHQSCMNDIKTYLTSESMFGDMRKFLQTEYELSWYKFYATYLAMKIKLSKEGDTQIRNKYYSEVFRETYQKMKKSEYGSLPDFQKLERSLYAHKFLSTRDMVKLLPFLQDYLADTIGLYQPESYKDIALNYMDLKMLEFAAEMEDSFTEQEKKPHNYGEGPMEPYLLDPMEPFLIKLNAIQSDRLYGKNIDKTFNDVLNVIVSPRRESIDNFIKNIKLPNNCNEERKDYAEIINSSVFYHRNKKNPLLYTSHEYIDTLFNALKSRTDLREQKSVSLRSRVFYYGKGSSWGRYE